LKGVCEHGYSGEDCACDDDPEPCTENGVCFLPFDLGIFCRVKSAILNLTGDMLQQWFMRMWEMLLLCWMGVFELISYLKYSSLFF
jgi:hypothetical protein